MTAAWRRVVFGLGLLLLLAPVVSVARHMPAFGDHPLPYGDAINTGAPRDRHVSNAVSAVNFDYRGFDTLGEEFMLVTAVTGAVVLLRGSRGEGVTARPGTLPDRPIPERSDAVWLIGRLIGPFAMVFGLYVVLHATVTPGGGFQGGVIITSGLLLLFLNDGYRSWRRIIRSPMLDALEGGGALLFALAGLAPMFLGAAYLQNILPFGSFRDMLSGGLMPVVNAGVAFAVLAGFSLVFMEFLEETRQPDEQE
ncbi:MAG: MnhB domain-containing protein [Rhodopila sp.]